MEADCGRLIRKSLIRLQVGGGRQRVKFIDQDVWNNGIKSRGIVHKWHPDVAVPAFQIIQDCMESDGYGVIYEITLTTSGSFWFWAVWAVAQGGIKNEGTCFCVGCALNKFSIAFMLKQLMGSWHPEYVQ
ncbi:hypothetical protein GOODEAATRI_007374 [Goodea atripinnis]|uniref:Uncharacterized protein n=1 Tax=Goodea atripinnis TaxID=208336 RepID=A0ABV0MZH0_9TELE